MAHKNPVEGKRGKNGIENKCENFEKYVQYLACIDLQHSMGYMGLMCMQYLLLDDECVKADSQYQKRSDQRPTTAPRPVAVLSQGVAGGRRDQNAEVEHGSTSATGDSVAGPVSIEM